MTKLQAIMTAFINLIGEDKVSDLLQSLGCYDAPTADTCIAVLDQCGEKFAVPFGHMLQDATKDPAAKKQILAAAKIAKASGQKTSTLTAEQKSNMALSWVNTLGGLLTTGISSASQLNNSINGTDLALAEVEKLRQEREYEQAKQKTTLYWILGGIGILLIVVIFVIALSKRS